MIRVLVGMSSMVLACCCLLAAVSWRLSTGDRLYGVAAALALSVIGAALVFHDHGPTEEASPPVLALCPRCQRLPARTGCVCRRCKDDLAEDWEAELLAMDETTEER